jgi:hypothetical protein
MEIKGEISSGPFILSEQKPRFLQAQFEVLHELRPYGAIHYPVVYR